MGNPVAKERERCAELCEQEAEELRAEGTRSEHFAAASALAGMAKRIREIAPATRMADTRMAELRQALFMLDKAIDSIRSMDYGDEADWTRVIALHSAEVAVIVAARRLTRL